MAKLKLLITGAQGKAGEATIKHLVKGYLGSFEIHAAIYEQAKEEGLKKLEPYKEHVIFDFVDLENEESVAKCMDKIDMLLLIPPSHPNMVKYCTSFIEAARRSAVQFILFLSLIKSDEPGYEYGREYYKVEEQLVKAKVNFTILRAGFFYQTFELYAKDISSGTLCLPIGQGRFSPMDVKDVGVMLASMLYQAQIGEEIHRMVYNITGPEVLTCSHVAQAIKEALGIEIQIVDSQSERLASLPEREMNGLEEYYNLVKSNAMNLISYDFGNLTGMRGTTLKEYFAENRSIYQ